MHCCVCRLSLDDPRFLTDGDGQPLYFRDPRFGFDRDPLTGLVKLFCSPGHSLVDHLRAAGQPLPEWLTAEVPAHG